MCNSGIRRFSIAAVLGVAIVAGPATAAMPSHGSASEGAVHDIGRSTARTVDGFPNLPAFFDRYRRNHSEQPDYDRPGKLRLREVGPETENEDARIQSRITLRYGDPVVVRFARSLSNEQGQRFFEEASRLVDARHLQPASYAARIRRAVRHLMIAVDNEVFLRAIRISPGDFAIDGFRHQLTRLVSSSRVRNRNDAVRLLGSAMTIAERTIGLRRGVVALEFVNATTDSLDRYSGFEPTSEPRQPGVAADSHVVGIGVEVRQHEVGLEIVRALRGGPAAEAGLRKGDLVLTVNGQLVAGESLAYAVDLIGGPSGSQVLLRVRRESGGENVVTLTRRRVQLFSVNDVRIVDPDRAVGYLSLNRFASSTAQELDRAVRELRARGMKSLIVDVRGNPGGLLTTCVDIANRFLPCGTIVSTRGRQSTDNTLETANFARTWNLPLVVLTDRNSASASEIFAAAIQENGRGLVVGERSYGKGTVQTHFPMASVTGNLRLTTAKFYSPAGRAMAGKGVEPDVLVVDKDGPIGTDRVLHRAIRIAAGSRLSNMAATPRSCRGKLRHTSELTRTNELTALVIGRDFD